jgi:hypothetical protein
MAASLQKKIQLARRAILVDKSGLVESCFSIVGHGISVYFAFMDEVPQKLAGDATIEHSAPGTSG